MWNKTSLLAASVSALALLAPATAAHAQQVPIEFYVCQGPAANSFCGPTNDSSYVGPGFDSNFTGSSSVAGAASEASATNGVVNDAYDGWGALYGANATAFNGLAAARQTQTYVAVPGLPGNSIRWFDSFTNNTGSAITANIAFGGNLGSDTSTFVHSIGQGFVVTGDGAPGASSSDPVIAHLYGNNTYAFTQTTVNFTNGDDNPTVVFPIEVAAGQTVSLMFVNLLFGDAARSNDPAGVAYAADVALAIQQAQLFVNSPILDGLTVQQLETLLNWDSNLIQIDGSLPGAGAISGLTGGLHDAYNALLDGNQSLLAVGSSTHASIEPLQYVGDTGPKKDGTQVFAATLGEAGGNVTMTATSESRTYLLGGYTTGDLQYSAGDLDFNGYLLGAGAERSVTSNMTLGIAGAYADGSGDMSGVYNDIASRSVIVSPYARLQDGSGTTVDGRVSFSWDDWDYDRVAGAGVASADFDGWSFGARLAASHDFEAGDYTYTPFASISYLRTSVGGYTETGAGAGNLIVPSFTSEQAEAFIGVSASRDWVLESGKAMNGFVSAGIGTGFLGDETISTQFTSSATAFTSQVETVDGAFARVGVGLTAEIQSGIKLTGTYGGTIGEDQTQHTFGAKLTASF